MLVRLRSVALVLFVILAAGTARAEDDDLEAYRARVKEGNSHYEAGRYADAVVVWRAVYDELGPSKAYRLSYNLGRAYEAIGDPTRAAERYASFLDELEKRHASGERTAEADKYATEARERLAALSAQHGRIRVAGSSPPAIVRVDSQEPRPSGFVAFVRPGAHKITFGVGSSNETSFEVRVDRGQIVDVAAPAPSTSNPPTRTRNDERAAPASAGQEETVRPFSPVILVVGAGVTLASIAVPIVTYTRALEAKDAYDATPTSDQAARDRAAAEYDDRRSIAELSLVLPISLAAITAGLVGWYFLGSRPNTTTTFVHASPFAARDRAGVALSGTF